MGRLEHLIVASLLAFVGSAQAATQVQVVGLFPGAAVLNVDGLRKLVKVGQTGPGGVQVISADSRGAVLRVDGVERPYSLSRESSAGFAAPGKSQTSIARGGDGHYRVAGSIGGQPMQFLVDTGATSVAIGAAEADRMGLDYRSGQPIALRTANGNAQGWRIKLPSVRVGDVELRDVDAVITPQAMPYVLLGNSFLTQFQMTRLNDQMVLEKRF